MSKGFPTRITRAGLGPILENAARVRSATRSASADLLNLTLWQLAGVNMGAPRGWALCTVSGSVITVARRALSWDPDGELPGNELVFTRSSAGVYTWAFAATSYPDFDEEDAPLDLVACVPVAQGTTQLKMVGDVSVDGASGTVNSYNSADAATDAAKFFVVFV